MDYWKISILIATYVCEILIPTKIKEMAINFSQTKYNFYLKSLEMHMTKNLDFTGRRIYFFSIALSLRWEVLDWRRGTGTVYFECTPWEGEKGRIQKRKGTAPPVVGYMGFSGDYWIQVPDTCFYGTAWSRLWKLFSFLHRQGCVGGVGSRYTT